MGVNPVPRHPDTGRGLAIVWAGRLTSLLGDGVYLVAIVWLTLKLEQSAGALALVGAAYTAPQILTLVVSGSIVDRVSRKRVIITADVIRAGSTATVAVLYIGGTLTLPVLIIATFCNGVAEGFFQPAFRAFIPELVEGDALVRTNAIERILESGIGRMLGPAIGGIVVAAGGLGVALTFNATSFAVSALCIAATRLSAPVRTAPNTEEGLLAEIRAGWSYIARERWLGVTLLMAALQLFLFVGPFEILLPIMLRDELHTGSATFGAALAAMGGGSALAGILMARRGLPRRPLATTYFAWAIASASPIGFALAGSPVAVVGIAFCAGFGFGWGLVIWGTRLQQTVPDHLLGRVSAVDALLSTALVPLSMLLTAPAAAAWGPRPVLLFAGVSAAAVTASAYAASGAVRRADSPPGAVSLADAA